MAYDKQAIETHAQNLAMWADNEGLPADYVPNDYIGTDARPYFEAEFMQARGIEVTA